MKVSFPLICPKDHCFILLFCPSAVSMETFIMLQASSEEHTHIPALEAYYPFD